MPSTVIATYNYNASTRILTVVFKSGLVYEYLDVPEEVYMAMKSSTSKGTFLNKNIKRVYAYNKKG